MSAYAPPSLDSTGLNLPTYQQILALLIANYQAIYGPGIYLGFDSADYQKIAIHALVLADAYGATLLDFNSRAPNFAVGPALDSLVKLNGLARKVASFSTCTVTITGTAGTEIVNGQIRDSVPGQGFLWSLPPDIIIPGGGSLNTTAICQVIGAVNALANQLNIIATPTAGWTSVNNAGAASPGQPVETDAQLRARQAISTELPSITTLAGTIADVAEVPGVTRSLCLENPTGAALTTWPIASSSPPWYGPAHSITCIVEGGVALVVATAIYNNRGIGCFTNPTASAGAQTIAVIDPNSGVSFNVGFTLPTPVPIYVIVNAHGLTPAFGAAVQTAIQTAVVAYLNALQLGGTVSWSAVMAVAMNAANNLVDTPIFDITTLFIGVAPAPTGVVDLPMTNPWNVAQGLTANVTVNSV